ncbi:CsgG/HfaB family protein [Aliarcobacter trophiarum]|uniref:CsgG/HfaB family protein n=1 Tax=Aliarcobacter trophiarum TaxID=708186 RepID=UPI00100A5C84|nr:CsgG/HfaB family protein [Aliarcobacter trophiarum]RXI28209.1 hypothetical protein CRU89_02015 [Aliarcobacter trophiarum]
MKTTTLFILFVAFFISGCSTKVLINSTKPAIIDRAANTKKVAVLKFENDSVGLSSKIESALYSVKVDDKSYFTVISKNSREAILNEQKFQYSGLSDRKNSVEIGELLGAEALISGKIDSSNMQKDNYYETRYRCVDKKCIYTKEYRVYCTNAKYSLIANISMIDVQKGDVIYTNNYIKNRSYKKCSDEGGGLPQSNVVYDLFAKSIVDEFLPYIAPTKQSYYLELFDDPDISYTKEQEIFLENGLEYLKLGELDRSMEIFSKLLNSTNDKCYVASYNLGVIKESLGEYENAKELYTLSDRLTLKPNKTVIEAISRIKQRIDEKDRLNSQMEGEK